LEDWLGAGAVAGALAAMGFSLSIEAQAAACSFERIAAAIPDALRAAVSGRELIEKGFAEDVDIAAQVDSLATVPVRYSTEILGEKVPGLFVAAT
jgi:2-phosphosulfolactate phosphatase